MALRVVKKLPAPPQAAAGLLWHISQHISTSYMTCSNLAVCLGPNLLRPVQEEQLDLEAMLSKNDTVMLPSAAGCSFAGQDVSVPYLCQLGCADVFVPYLPPSSLQPRLPAIAATQPLPSVQRHCSAVMARAAWQDLRPPGLKARLWRS